jgi:hypothetical protein
MTATQVLVYPGQTVQVSGQYRPLNGGGAETTLVKGHTAPPTPNGGPWVLVDRTVHKY